MSDRERETWPAERIERLREMVEGLGMSITRAAGFLDVPLDSAIKAAKRNGIVATRTKRPYRPNRITAPEDVA